MYTYIKEIDATLSPKSRVWIYQAMRPLTKSEKEQITSIFQDFVRVWKSHNNPLKAYFHLFFNQFLVVIADDSVPVSGCATDVLFHQIKRVENKYQLCLLDRNKIAIVQNQVVEMIALPTLLERIAMGKIQRETLFFDNSLYLLSDFLTCWITPIENSWLAKKALTRT